MIPLLEALTPKGRAGKVNTKGGIEYTKPGYGEHRSNYGATPGQLWGNYRATQV